MNEKFIVRQDGEEVVDGIIDFNRVHVGLERELTLTVENPNEVSLVNFKLLVEGAEIVSAPTYIPPFATADVVLNWSPSLDLREGLHGKLNLKGELEYKF